MPSGVFAVLKDSVPNVSGFVRRLVLDGLERLPVLFEMEEYRLEVEVARLTEELEKVHRWQLVGLLNRLMELKLSRSRDTQTRQKRGEKK